VLTALQPLLEFRLWSTRTHASGMPQIGKCGVGDLVESLFDDLA
jgi:hypothetical protein